MDGSLPIIAVLCGCLAVVIGLLVYQQRFYSQQIKDLIDRLMARSIGEFERAKNPPPPRVNITKEEPLEDLGRIVG